MASLSDLVRLAERHEPGPSPGFSGVHALLAFMTIGAAGTIGRQALAESSGLGEGSIRTVLKKFRQERYVVANTLGCQLTTSGRRLYESVMRKLTPLIPIEGSEFKLGAYHNAVLVRSSSASVGSGIEQRDSAIRAGAGGATTYIIKSGKFAVPGGSSDCEKDFPSKAWSILRAELKPRNGDAVIVCGASDGTMAKLGALSAALTLL